MSRSVVAPDEPLSRGYALDAGALMRTWQSENLVVYLIDDICELSSVSLTGMGILSDGLSREFLPPDFYLSFVGDAVWTSCSLFRTPVLCFALPWAHQLVGNRPIHLEQQEETIISQDKTSRTTSSDASTCCPTPHRYPRNRHASFPSFLTQPLSR